MKGDNIFFKMFSKLSATFSDNPLFNIIYRWLLISFLPTMFVYNICLFIFGQEKIAKFICFIVFMTITSFFIYSVIHLPKKEGTHYLYIMLYSDNNDTALITKGLTPKCISLSKNKSYNVLCPNKACRYFYNWVRLKYDTSNSKFLSFSTNILKIVIPYSYSGF